LEMLIYIIEETDAFVPLEIILKASPNSPRPLQNHYKVPLPLNLNQVLVGKQGQAREKYDFPITIMHCQNLTMYLESTF
jgi:hypothetical protein